MAKNARERLKALYGRPGEAADPRVLEQLAAQCRAVCPRPKRRIGFFAFLVRQLRFAGGWPGLLQAVLVLTCCGGLYRFCFAGDVWVRTPWLLALWLCAFGVLLALVSWPFLARSSAHAMRELELAAYYTLPPLVLARAIIVGAPTLVALTLVFAFTAVFMRPAAGQVHGMVVFALLPYLLGCIGCVPAMAPRRGRQGVGLCVAWCTALFGGLLLACRLNRQLFTLASASTWGLLCLGALALLCGEGVIAAVNMNRRDGLLRAR